MPHIRTQIRKAAITALEAADLGAAVLDSFAPAIQAEGLHISVSTPQTTNEPLSKDPGTPLRGTVLLDMVVINTATPADLSEQMDTIEMKAAAALEDNKLGGLLFSPFYPMATNAEFQKPGEIVVARMTVRFSGKYIANQSDLSTTT